MHHLSASTSVVRRQAAKAIKPVLARGFSNAAILQGVEVLTAAVSVTLDPKGAFKSRIVYARDCSD